MFQVMWLKTFLVEFFFFLKEVTTICINDQRKIFHKKLGPPQYIEAHQYFHHYVRKLASRKQVILENIIILMIWVLIFHNLGVFGPKPYEYMERLSFRKLVI